MNLQQLKNNLRSYLDQSEDELADSDLELVIRQGEAEIRRVMYDHPRLVKAASLPIVNKSADLPTDFGPVIEVVGMDDNTPLTQVQFLADMGADKFLLGGTQIVVGTDFDTVSMRYRARVPDITNDAGNWISDNHPDIYLYGCLKESALYARNKNWLPDWGGEFDRRVVQELTVSWNTNFS